MSKPSEALPQPEPPLYPQEQLQHQHDPLFAYFPGGHPLLGLTQVVISPQGEQNHILPPPSFPQVPQGHPQLHPHGGFAHPLLDLTHVAIQTNGLYPNMEYLLHPQDSYHPHGLVHLPHNDQGHPLVKPALHQGAGTATRWARPGLGAPPAMFFPPAVFQGHKQPLGPHTSVKGLWCWFTCIANNPKKKNMQNKFSFCVPYLSMSMSPEYVKICIIGEKSSGLP